MFVLRNVNCFHYEALYVLFVFCDTSLRHDLLLCDHSMKHSIDLLVIMDLNFIYVILSLNILFSQSFIFLKLTTCIFII